MKKFLRIAALFVAACLVASSCNSKTENDIITEQNLTDCFAYVTDLVEGPSAYYNNVGYKVRLNYSEPSAEVSISGLKLNDGTTYPTFTIKGLKFNIDKEGWAIVEGENLAPVVPGVAVSPTIGKFSMRLYQRVIGNLYSPAFSINMTIDHRYSVMSSYAGQACYGTTTSIADGMPAFETTSTEYVLAFNIETRCVTISVYKAQFMARMPAMDIVFKNVPFKIVGSKAYFEIDNLTPESNNTPYPAFPITNLKGELDFGSGLKLDFNCAPAMFEGAVFAVSADCGFDLPVDVAD